MSELPAAQLLHPAPLVETRKFRFAAVDVLKHVTIRHHTKTAILDDCEMKTKILFVCHGNICRSAIAEYLFQDMVRKSGQSDAFDIASAATSTEELGNPVYPPARRLLSQHGIDCSGHCARQITKADYGRFDLLIAMDGLKGLLKMKEERK